MEHVVWKTSKGLCSLQHTMNNFKITLCGKCVPDNAWELVPEEHLSIDLQCSICRDAERKVNEHPEE